MFLGTDRAKWLLQQDEQATDGRGWSVNLDLFRVVFLGAVALPWALRNLQWIFTVLPGLPREVWSPISFYQWIPYEVLSNVGLAKVLALPNLLFLFLGFFGILTRKSIGCAFVLSLYLFGLPENQGKVDHFHHVVWFLGLLAAGPAGRFLSIDSIRRAVRRADLGYADPPIRTFEALWTLRYVWCLLGLLYFIPGAAKLIRTFAWGWAMAPNLRNLLWTKWFEVSLFVPGSKLPPRLDLLPSWLLAAAGLSVIVFEMGFLFIVPLRRLRPYLALVGFLFHVGNGLILHIWFTTLIPVYVCLIDWAHLGRTISKKIGPLSVFYDGDCRMCRRTVAVLSSLDLFDGMTPKPMTSTTEGLDQHSEITQDMLSRDLYAVTAQKTAGGYDAYVLIASRLILLWPLSLLMRFSPLAKVGRRVYRRIADSRHCALVSPRREKKSMSEVQTSLLHPVGIALITCQFFVSGTMFLASESRAVARLFPAPLSRTITRIAAMRPVWPFSPYPTFANRWSNEVEIWEAKWVTPKGELLASPTAFDASFRNSGLAWSIVTDACQETNPGRFRELSIGLTRTLWQNEVLEIRTSANQVRVYCARYRLGPTDPPGTLLGESLKYASPLSTVQP